MEKTLVSILPQYIQSGLYEYSLMIRPGRELCDRITEEKTFFSDSYNYPVESKTKPGLVLCTFIAWESMEDTLIRWIQRIAREQKQFTVLLNNYSGFPSHTIFIRVMDPSPFRQLAARLKTISPYIKENSSYPARFMSYPHVSIASRLPLKVYDQAIKDYAGKDFAASFMVNELMLFRRQHQLEPGNQVAIFPLKPDESLNN